MTSILPGSAAKTPLFFASATLAVATLTPIALIPLRSRVRVANRARRPIDNNAITAPAAAAAAEEPVVEVPR